jgi:hypothetical protein
VLVPNIKGRKRVLANGSNPSYSGGRNQEDQFVATWEEKFKRPYLEQ